MKSTIFVKFLVLCLAISLSTGILIFLASYFQTKDHLYAQVNVNLKEKSNLMMRSVDRFVHERLEDIHVLAVEPSIVNGHKNIQQLHVYIEAFVKDHRVYESVSYFDLSRRRLYDSRNLSVGAVHSKSKYWNSLDNHEHALDISISESLNLPVMHFAKKVYSVEGKHVGYIVARMRIENLYNVFEDFLENDHNRIEQIEVSLLDTNGGFLYSNIQPERILKSAYQYYPLIKKTLAVEKGMASHVIDRPKQLLFVHRQNGYGRYEGSKWLLVLQINKSAVLAPVHALRDNMLNMAFMVLIAVAIISVAFSHYFTQPFRLLARAAHEYGNGNFDFRFTLKTNDERQRLAELMSLMAEKLKFRINRQERLNKALQTSMDAMRIQKAKIEEQNNLIKSSIEYARHIQNAMLVNVSQTRNPFFQMEVFLKPLNIVSGDYYFFHRMQHEQLGEVYVGAIVDCTGHGVAGAFMTIMAHNLLNRIVVNEKTANPGSIMKGMDVGLNQMLNYSATDLHNGMDLAVCTYIVAENKLQFCGANRNLLLVDKAGVLQEYKGVRIGLGDRHLLCRTVQLLNCEVTEILPNAGDRIYLYTDGVSDQFGGKAEKKFSSRRLRTLLSNIADQSFGDGFRFIVDEINSWMGNTPQTDDMLLFGWEFLEADTQLQKQAEELQEINDNESLMK